MNCYQLTEVTEEEDCSRDVSGECTVFVGDVTLSTEADAAALAGYDAVVGDLIILVGPAAESLRGIRYVSGAFGYGGHALDYLSGFTDLEVVGGDFTLFCVAGTSVDMFGSLEAVGGGVSLIGAAQLPAFSLPSLQEIGGALVLEEASDESCAGSVRGLDALTSVGPFGDLTRTGGLGISHTVSLERLEGLSSLEQIDGGVEFLDNRALSECAIAAFLSEIDVSGEITEQYNAGCR